jgi:hypothetical protein
MGSTVRQASEALSHHGRLKIVQRDYVPRFIFGPEDTVVVLGQDGLVANVLKCLDGQLLVGVNPAPADGRAYCFHSQCLTLITLYLKCSDTPGRFWMLQWPRRG